MDLTISPVRREYRSAQLYGGLALQGKACAQFPDKPSEHVSYDLFKALRKHKTNIPEKENASKINVSVCA